MPLLIASNIRTIFLFVRFLCTFSTNLMITIVSLHLTFTRRGALQELSAIFGSTYKAMGTWIIPLQVGHNSSSSSSSPSSSSSSPLTLMNLTGLVCVGWPHWHFGALVFFVKSHKIDVLDKIEWTASAVSSVSWLFSAVIFFRSGSSVSHGGTVENAWKNALASSSESGLSSFAFTALLAVLEQSHHRRDILCSAARAEAAE